MSQTKLIQALVTCTRHQKILLGRWNKGAFQGRVSGMIGEATEGQSPEEAASYLCRTLSGLDISSSKFARRALFTFHEVDASDPAAKDLGVEYQELQLVCDVDDHAMFTPTNSTLFSPLGWIPFEHIPYFEMPEDDAIWYPQVLNSNAILEGEFKFDGTKLLSCDVRTVSWDEFTGKH
eukprot:m.292355 g.292355  ORF g.292355 m.292355 type:complete len:178 (-) comp229665_c0_seq1:18-551(-)